MSRGRISRRAGAQVRIVGLFGPDPMRLTMPDVRMYLRWFLSQRATLPECAPESRRAELDRKIELLRDALHREGFCRECGRALSDPHSVESGIGPECRRKLGAAS